MMEVVTITGAIRHAKLQSNCHHQQTNTQLFTNRVSACHPTNSVKALKGNNITIHGLAHPRLTWSLPTLSLTTKGSWLSQGGLPNLWSALWCQ